MRQFGIDATEQSLSVGEIVRVLPQWIKTNETIEELIEKDLEFKRSANKADKGTIYYKNPEPLDFGGDAPFGVVLENQKVQVYYDGEDHIVSMKDYDIERTSDTVTSLEDAYTIGGEDIRQYTQSSSE